MRSTTVRLDADIDPFEVGIRTGLLWCHAAADDPVPLLAGIGEAARVDLERPDGAVGAQARLRALAGANEVTGPGTGPVAFGALPFDRAAPGELIVPEIVVGRGADGRRWLTVTTAEGDVRADGAAGRAEPGDPAADDGGGTVGSTVERALDRVRALLASESDSASAPGPSPAPEPSEFELIATMPPARWRDEVVALGRNQIAAGGLDKVVLARELVLRTDQPLSPGAVLVRLRAAFPAAIVFAVDGFVGASPELLVGRHGDIVRAHPLAGTAARASDPAADQRAAAALLGSTKDRWEHRITIEWLLAGLLPFCSYVDAEPEPSIVSLANVHHLGTLVEGRLSSPAASVLELVGALHPTPAVGGDPQAVALALIDEIEGFDRGRYAGPVGWLDAEGNGAFAVGIRSAEIAGCEARIMAGVGVVADSDPAAELVETRNKFRAMLGALIQP